MGGGGELETQVKIGINGEIDTDTAVSRHVARAFLLREGPSREMITISTYYCVYIYLYVCMIYYRNL